MAFTQSLSGANRFRASLKSSLPVFALLIALTSASAVEAKVHPYSGDYEARISELFLSNGQPSTAKIDAYIQRLQTKRNQVIQLFVNADKAKASKKGKTPKLEKYLKDAKEEDITVAVTTAIELLQKMKSAKSLADIMDYGYDTLDLEDIVRIKGDELASVVVPRSMKDALTPWTVKMVSKADDEASNLVGPNGHFLSVSDIQKLKSQNADLSKFQPGSVSEFWEAQKNISQISVRDAALGRTLKFYEGGDVQFPADATVMLDEVVYSDTKPKMDAYVENSKGKKVKFRLKFGREIHAEPTAAALSMTLGYPADIHKFMKTLKVYIGKKSVADITRDWEFYYKPNGLRDPVSIKNSLVSSGKDSKGNFIVFKNVSMEARPKNVDRLGGWQLADNSNLTRREARGLMLVSMWLDNTDYQEFNNNKVLAHIENGKIVSKIHMISDLGHTFGGLSQENPDQFKAKLVESKSADEIKFTFKSFTNSPLKGKMTYADVKWSARLIAQLTRSQIETAFELGGWPTCMEQTFVEKAISRRNDLVSAFGLIGEKQSDGSTIQLIGPRAGMMKMAEACEPSLLESGDFQPGFEYDFGTLISTVGRVAWDGAMDLARGAAGGGTRVRVAPARFNPGDKLKLGPVVELIASAPRTIEKNPDPTNPNDLYIVKDEFEVGVRLGVAYGIYKDVVVTKRYSLAYGVRTLEEGKNKNGFIVDLALPARLRKGQVPTKYVMKTETFISHGEGLELRDPTLLLAPGFRIGHDRVFLGRAILDARDEKQVLLYRDNAKYNQIVKEAFASIGIFRLPLLNITSAQGASEGAAVVIDRASFDSNTSKRDQIAAAVASGNFEPFAKAEKKLSMERDFKSKTKGWNLILFKGKSETEFDHITLTEGDSTRDTLQLRSTKEKSFAFLDRKETHSVRIEVSGDGDREGSRVVSVKAVGLDSNTKNKELSKGYLKFINGLSLDGQRVIDFDPELFSVNGKWGKTATESETTFYSEGVSRVMQMTDGHFWAAVAKVSGVTPSKMASLVQTYRQVLKTPTGRGAGNLQSSLYAKGIDDSTAALISHGLKILSKVGKIEKANTEQKLFERVGSLFREAVYARGAFYEPRLLNALSTIAGEQNVYGRHVVTTMGDGEVALVGEKPLIGEVGQRRDDPRSEYIMVKPQTALDLYNMFDSWF